jgi:rubrerythrin
VTDERAERAVLSHAEAYRLVAEAQEQRARADAAEAREASLRADLAAANERYEAQVERLKDAIERAKDFPCPECGHRLSVACTCRAGESHP